MRMNFKIVFPLLSMAISTFSMAPDSISAFAKQEQNTPQRETVFDRIITMPIPLKLDIPYHPPYCDEIPNLKKGFIKAHDGARIYYEEEGSGIPLVLIAGGPGSTHHKFHPHFSVLNDTARVIYYDRRGIGQSDIDSTCKSYTIKQSVEDLETLRKALGIKRWVMLGWSDGGLIAQYYALTYPDRLKGLILLASNHGLFKTRVNPSRQNLFISAEEHQSIQDVVRAARENKISCIQARYNKTLRGDWKRQHYYKPSQEDLERETLYGWKPSPGLIECILEDERKISLEGKFADFEVPTLIIESINDLTWNLDKTELMRKNHPQAQIEIFTKASHYIFGDEPEKFFTLVRSFLKQTAKAKIEYKPGNRISWPPCAHKLGRMLARADSLNIEKPENPQEKNALMQQCFERATRKNTQDWLVWKRLAEYYIQTHTHPDCFYEALVRLETLLKKSCSPTWKTYGYVIKTWQGHMLDLLGKHAEALDCYKQSLALNKGRRDIWFKTSSMRITSDWINQKIKRPFRWNT